MALWIRKGDIRGDGQVTLGGQTGNIRGAGHMTLGVTLQHKRMLILNQVLTYTDC